MGNRWGNSGNSARELTLESIKEWELKGNHLNRRPLLSGKGFSLTSCVIFMCYFAMWISLFLKYLQHARPLASANHCSSLWRTPHLNDKQNKDTDPVSSRQDYHLPQPYPSEGKQTNKQKISTNLTLYEAYTNPWTKLMGAETKRKKEFNLLQGREFNFPWSLGKWKWSCSVVSDSLWPCGL